MKINGSARNDTLFGSAGSDLLAGKGGDDIVFGYAGDDRLYGGLGNDLVDGGEGYDEIRGRDGNDTLIGGEGYAFITGDRGNDIIIAGWNYSAIYGGEGDDTLVLAHGSANGGAGNDFIDVGEWDDFGWQSRAAVGTPRVTDEELDGPTYVDGGEGTDAVRMAFRLGEDGMSVGWSDYTPGERLELLVFAEDGTPLLDDAATKAWLDTNDDGMLSDADGDGGWLDVSYNAANGSLTLRVQNDSITIGYAPFGTPVDHLFI